MKIITLIAVLALGACQAHELEADDVEQLDLVPFAGETNPELRIHCHSNCTGAFNIQHEYCENAYFSHWHKCFEPPIWPNGANACLYPTGNVYFDLGQRCNRDALEWQWECFDWCDAYPF